MYNPSVSNNQATPDHSRRSTSNMTGYTATIPPEDLQVLVHRPSGRMTRSVFDSVLVVSGSTSGTNDALQLRADLFPGERADENGGSTRLAASLNNLLKRERWAIDKSVLLGGHRVENVGDDRSFRDSAKDVAWTLRLLYEKTKPDETKVSKVSFKFMDEQDLAKVLNGEYGVDLWKTNGKYLRNLDNEKYGTGLLDCLDTLKSMPLTRQCSSWWRNPRSFVPVHSASSGVDPTEHGGWPLINHRITCNVNARRLAANKDKLLASSSALQLGRAIAPNDQWSLGQTSKGITSRPPQLALPPRYQGVDDGPRKRSRLSLPTDHNPLPSRNGALNLMPPEMPDRFAEFLPRLGTNYPMPEASMPHSATVNSRASGLITGGMPGDDRDHGRPVLASMTPYNQQQSLTQPRYGQTSSGYGAAPVISNSNDPFGFNQFFDQQDRLANSHVSESASAPQSYPQTQYDAQHPSSFNTHTHGYQPSFASNGSLFDVGTNQYDSTIYPTPPSQRRGPRRQG